MKSSTEIVDEERRMTRTTAIGLGAWLALTLAAVALLSFGDGSSSPVV